MHFYFMTSRNFEINGSRMCWTFVFTISYNSKFTQIRMEKSLRDGRQRAGSKMRSRSKWRLFTESIESGDFARWSPSPKKIHDMCLRRTNKICKPATQILIWDWVMPQLISISIWDVFGHSNQPVGYDTGMKRSQRRSYGLSFPNTWELWLVIIPSDLQSYRITYPIE